MLRDNGKGQMGDTQDGSTGVAHSAHDDLEQKHTGIFRRMIDALRPQTEDIQPTYDVQASGGAQPAVMPGMVNLSRMRVEDVMIPKAEIVSVSIDSSKDDLVAYFRESGLTRIPVFDGTLDRPIGFVHLKDLALQHVFSDGATPATPYVLRDIVRPLLYVPPSMPIGVLLQKMQTERIHMALVIDEYGGVDGLLTIEDLIEQVIGEIEDEHDLEEGALWIEEKPGCYLAEAKAPLDEFEAEIGQSLRGHELDDEEVETLGGLVFLLRGQVPARGEVIMHPDGTEIEVVDADPRRIKRLRVYLSTGRDV